MKNTMGRDNYENIDRAYMTMLLQEWQKRYKNITITDIKESEDPLSSWDMSATINGEIKYIELKGRTNKYPYSKVIDKGLYFRAHKNDGKNSLLVSVFPDDRIVAITTPELIKDLKPLKTKVNHKYTVDEDSEEDVQDNYIIPKELWYIYKIYPYKVLSLPKNKLISKPEKT